MNKIVQIICGLGIIGIAIAAGILGRLPLLWMAVVLILQLHLLLLYWVKR